MGAAGSQFEDVISGKSIQRAQKDVDRHILCYGDNLTLGFCSNGSQKKPYAAALSDALLRVGIRCRVSVGGLSGHTAKQMVSAIDRPEVKDAKGRLVGKGLGKIIEEEGPFDLCIIMAGTNDLTLLSRSEDIVKDLRNLHAAAHNRGVPTIALAPPSPQHAAQAELAQLLAQWVQTAQPVLTFANAEDLAPRSLKGFWEPDSVHLSPAGSAALGQKLMMNLLPVLSYLEWGEDATKAYIELTMQKQRQLAHGQSRPHPARAGA
jgi:lysophospholipase L1-like esterase